jgi:putative aldouronate transport system permease protein
MVQRTGKGFVYVVRRDAWLLLFCLPAVIYMVALNYAPIWGIQIAFKKFSAARGIWGSEWIGFANFQRYFVSPYFQRTFGNTLLLSLLQLLIGFPVPIVLSLMLNQVDNYGFKRVVQTMTYAPHFISVVVMAGMLHLFLSPSVGLVNNIIRMVGSKPIFFLAKPSYFRWIYVLSGVWQNAGWGMIIYLAAISSIDPTLYEAAIVDGASRMQRIIHVDIPCILPTIVIVLVLRLGRLMDVGWQKAFLLQNQLNLEASELIQTYVYKVGILQGEYHYSAAIGLLNSFINLVLILSVNQLAKKLRQETLI